MDHDEPAIPIDPDLDPSDPAEPRVSPSRGQSLRGQRLHRARPGVLAAIGLGGMVGATARYGLAQWLPTSPGRFPWATFWTNLAGSFLLGLLLVAILDRFPKSRQAEPVSGRPEPLGKDPRPQSSLRWLVHPFVATGVLGAFTTMSTYAVEAALLLNDGHPLTAILYLGTSLAAGLTLAYAGISAGRQISGRRAAATSTPA